MLRWTLLVALTLYGFYAVPGHSYLVSDTQIYVPMLDRIHDSSLFARELVAQRQHLALTLYDEVILSLAAITGLGYEPILTAIQLLTRLVGFYGLFLIATSLGLAELPALLVPAIVGLGAAVHGPAILTIEYEPVPRGFAAMLTLLALGFAMHGRPKAAAIASSIAFLFHAPAVLPFLMAFALYQLWQRDLRPLLYILAAFAAAALFSRLQPGMVEPQLFFSTVDPDWEKLQRLRASYNWIGMWKPWFFWNFTVFATLALLALARLWRHIESPRQRFYAIALPLIGIASIPVGWLLLERYKWALMAQVQPARSVLFTIYVALILTVAAACFAARQRRWVESALWLFPGLFLFFHGYLWEAFDIPTVDLQWSLLATIVATAALAFPNRILAAALILAVPVVSGSIWKEHLHRANYPDPPSAELLDAAAWARANTPKDAMFLLPEFVRSFESGVFRVRAQRALYVDWKIGGQVNYSRPLSFEWNRRIQVLAEKPEPTAHRLAAEGVDYLVLKAATACPTPEVYRNKSFAICKLNR